MRIDFIERFKKTAFIILTALSVMTTVGFAEPVMAAEAGFAQESVFVRGTSAVGYNKLNDTQKKYYKKIDYEINSFINSSGSLYPSTFYDEKGVSYQRYVIGYRIDYYQDKLYDVNAAYRAYDYDHPAYYWISNDVLVDDINKYFYILTEPDYASSTERDRINALVEDGVKELAALANKGKSTIDKIKIVHDEIVSRVDYAHKIENGKRVPETAKWAHSVQGVFDSQKSVVCEGYGDAFSLVMNYMGIPNYYITGDASNSGPGGGEGHVWNAVSDDGGKTYKYMDLTWDDSGVSGVNHTFFAMPKTEFEKTHFKYDSTGLNGKWLYDISTDNFYDGEPEKKEQESEPGKKTDPEKKSEDKPKPDNKQEKKPVKKPVINASSIRLSKKTAKVDFKKKVTLKATVKPSNATLVWENSNPKAASISVKGNTAIITGLKKGKTTITLKSANGKKKATCRVTSNGPVEVKRVSITKKTSRVYVGKDLKLKAVIYPSKAFDKKVTWSNLTPSVARLESKGLNATLTGLKDGKAKVRVTGANGKRKEVTITVKAPKAKKNKKK